MNIYQDPKFLISRRCAVNACMRKLASAGYLDKEAQWQAIGRGALGAGKWLMGHKGLALAGAINVPFAYGDAKSLVGEYKNQANPGGSRFITADGHRRSGGATALRTAGFLANWLWLIPGVGWIPGMALNFAANAAADVVQRRADKQWAKSQEWLRRGGINPSSSYGTYGNNPGM